VVLHDLRPTEIESHVRLLITRMAPQTVIDLVEHFERNEDAFRSGGYNEAQLRREFLDPFFEALGWDVSNRLGAAEAYKDVIHEDAIKVGEGTKAPDYCFRIGGTRKFFLEAKKPAVNIKTDGHSAFQLRRYAWSSKLPLSILSNFAEFAVYDCRVQPLQSDKASTARVLFFTYDQYLEHWQEIAGAFSKDAVIKGFFDKFIASTKLKRGTAEVDDAFLKEIEKWRRELASNIALRNPGLSQRELNFAVQRTIDRIIFLRICEDRGIEKYGQLRDLQSSDNIYQQLCAIFQRADDRYNSGLFHFLAEKNRAEQPDTLTLKLRIDDERLKGILKRLYYPDSPYEFSVLPVDILGQVYEQFLGKVIILTPSHHATVKEKPEVKKAGGVYYTPTYIVEYIVRHTVGKLLEGKTPKQAARLRILDPACGSGSFLIGAYQFLITWHREWYLKDGAEKHAKEIYQGAGGEWHLTISEKKRILRNNIYGVDIDTQAVEVTKLSLLLKVLEGESEQTLHTTLRLFHERALPDLGNNVKCGNSLVDQQISLLGEDERFRINVFDWKVGFQDVMRSGGFDAVIGNPPYSYRNATEKALRPYYLSTYKSAEGNFELYKFFVERNIDLCRPEGLVGMIVSATFLVQPTFQKLRRILLGNELVMLAPLGPNVFKKATVDTTILVVKKATADDKHTVLIVAPATPLELPRTAAYTVQQARFAQNDSLAFDYRLSDTAATIVERLFKTFPTIEKGYEFGVGINTGYVRRELVANRRVDARYHRMVPGSGISRYGQAETDGWIMYDPEYVRRRGSRGRTLPAEHLLSSEKILVVRTRNLSLKRRIIATIDTTGAYNLNRLSNIVARDGYSLRGLLGILNSQLFQWLFATRFFDYEIKPVYLRIAPLADSNDAPLESAVAQMLCLKERLNNVRTDHERTIIQREIEALDRNIDIRVYQLYGLSDEEIAIAETAQPGKFE
jgi:type I restriction-modification system DNA methylase subunit